MSGKYPPPNRNNRYNNGNKYRNDESGKSQSFVNNYENNRYDNRRNNRGYR